MTSVGRLVDWSVSQHSRNILVLAIEMPRHNPSLRKPDLTREVKHTIRMFHLPQLLEQHWLPLVSEQNSVRKLPVRQKIITDQSST